MATEHGPTLLALARGALAQALYRTSPVPTLPAGALWLHELGATFVTLTQRGQLRGCIGTLEPHRPLHADVQANAVAAALRDPRFAPLAIHELAHTAIEVSLLSGREPLSFGSEAEALALLRPGTDGVVLACGQRRSTFLPQVWEQLSEPAEFLAQLKAKAGLPRDFWSSQMQLERYTVRKWKEAGPGAGAAGTREEQV